MKKIIIFLLISLIFITGCTYSETSINTNESTINAINNKVYDTSLGEINCGHPSNGTERSICDQIESDERGQQYQEEPWDNWRY